MAGKGDMSREVDPEKWNNAPFWKARDERKRKADQQRDVSLSAKESSANASSEGQKDGMAESRKC